VPSDEEVEDLKIFAQQLAITIKKSERINFLQTTLDKTRDAVVIMDRKERFRYINDSAGELFNCHSGWQDPSKNDLVNMKIGKFIPSFMRTLIDDIRSVKHVKGVGVRGDYYGEVLFDCIKDWQGQTTGALLHVQDITYINKIVEAFMLVASSQDSESAMLNILNATKLLGHKWGRLYITEENNPDCLVSKLSFGFGDSNLEKEFNAGKLKLPDDDHYWGSWISIKEGTPQVLSYLKGYEDQWSFQTEKGLYVINIRNPVSAKFLKKQPGVFWIEFPIIANNKPLGKLSLHCEEGLMPERFEMLKLLANMYTEFLNAFLLRDRVAEKEKWIQQAAERSVATMSHNIATRLASLPFYLDEYRDEEKNRKNLLNINNRFEHVINEISDIINRAKDLLTVATPRITSFNIYDEIKLTLRTALHENNLTINGNASDLCIEADKHLLRGALAEIIQNSKSLCKPIEKLHVRVTINQLTIKSKKWLRIEYKDNGPGVKKEYKKKIFEDFFTHRPGDKSGQGLGLGYVCRVVKAHGGKIKEIGNPANGAKFIIKIPQFAKNNVKESNNV